MIKGARRLVSSFIRKRTACSTMLKAGLDAGEQCEKGGVSTAFFVILLTNDPSSSNTRTSRLRGFFRASCFSHGASLGCRALFCHCRSCLASAALLCFDRPSLVCGKWK